LNISENKYRIAYEAFSKFSSKLSKVEEEDKVYTLIQENLKYLFNFRVFRILIVQQENVKAFTFNASFAQTETLEKKELFEYEKELLKKNIPIFKPYQENLLKEKVQNPLGSQAKLWGWYYQYQETELCVSLVSDIEKPFTTKDIQLLNLVIDNVITKYQHIILKKRLDTQNKNLLDAISVIENQNLHISKIVENQKEIIKKRTNSLSRKNKKLAEIIKLNAHNLREPLSRILGLLEIAEYFPPEELKNEVLEKIKVSSAELDKKFIEVIDKSTEEIEKFSI